jgi:hypothetical protein
MPTYDFLNSETNEVEEHRMSYTEYDDFIKNNTHLTRYFSAENLPILGDGMRMNTPGVGKPDSTFEKYVINRMKETIPGNTIKDGHKTKAPREW